MKQADRVSDGLPSPPVRANAGFAKDVVKLMSGTAFAQLLTVLAAPFLARLYHPEDFGVVALFGSLTGVLAVIACLRYEVAIMLPDNDVEAANLLAVSLICTIVITVFTLPVVWWGDKLLLGWLNAGELAPYLWLVPLMTLILGTFSALSYWNSRNKQFGRLSIAKVVSASTTVAAQLGFGFAGFANSQTLIGAVVGGQALITSVLGGQIWRDDGQLFLRSIKWREMLQGVRRYRKFPMIDIWGALMNSISWQLPVLLLSAFFPQAVVGYYAFSFRFIQLPMSLIGGTLGQVYFQRISDAKSSQSELAEISETVFRRLVALFLLPALLLSVIGSDIFALAFGDRWAEAGTYTQILSIWMFLWLVSSPLSSIFTVLERQGLALGVHLTLLVTRAVSLYLGGIWGDVYLAIGLFAVSGSIFYGGLSVWNLSMAGVRPRDTFLIYFRYLLYSLPAVAFLLMMKTWGAEPAWLTIAATAEAAVYYLLIIRSEPDLYQNSHSPRLSPKT